MLHDVPGVGALLCNSGRMSAMTHVPCNPQARRYSGPAALQRCIGVLTAPGRKAGACAQAAVLPGLDRGVELVPGDVFQYATLPRALGDANALIIATGARAALDPFGPFSVDYEARPGVPSAVTSTTGLNVAVSVPVHPRACATRCVLNGAQGVVNLVTAAQRQGRVRRVVLVSSIGADDPFFPLNLLWGVRPRPCLS